jgi:predicted transcriptional regulator
MDFKKAAILGSYISKDYAEDLFRLLATYRDISASEAASRLDMHIKTVQDFFEAMASLNILTKNEVYEKKRPYYRYALKTDKIKMEIDLLPLMAKKEKPQGKLAQQIREHKNTGVRFTTARNNQYISSVVIWIGEGRERSERRINLTLPQGKFMFNLPFPSAEYMSIADIMEKAEVEDRNTSEILDIVDVFIQYKVIEVSEKC